MKLIINKEPYKLKDWFAEKENIPGINAVIERETEKAYLLAFDNDVSKWFPKSVLTKMEITGNGTLDQFIEVDEGGRYP